MCFTLDGDHFFAYLFFLFVLILLFMNPSLNALLKDLFGDFLFKR